MAYKSKTGDNDMGWWTDQNIVDPPYLTPEPGQDGNDLDFYAASRMGFKSGMYPNDTPVPCGDADSDGS